MTDLPPLDPAVRQAIRARGRRLQRRRRGVFATAAAAVIAAVVPTVLLSRASKPKPVPVATAADCPAASVPVQVRVGASASLERVPQGWTLTHGNPNQPDQGLTYASPAEQAKAQQMERYTTYTAPSATLSVTFPSLGLTAADTVPPLANGSPHPPMPGTTTSTAVVNGFPAKVTITYSGPAGQAPSPAFPQDENISWTPAAGTTLSVEGTNIPPAEMLDIARSATYRPGTVEQLPPNPSYAVTSAVAEHALPPTLRPAGHAALSAWAEIENVGRLHDSGPVDYRPAWLVYAPAGTDKVTWAIVDAKTDRTLRPVATTAAGWVYGVADRSKPGCQPPLGVLTRSEYSELLYGGAPPAGDQLILTSGPDAAALVEGSSSPCTMACDPLVWISYVPGTQTNITFSDPFTGQVMATMTGGTPSKDPAPRGLGAGSRTSVTPRSQRADHCHPVWWAGRTGRFCVVFHHIHDHSDRRPVTVLSRHPRGPPRSRRQR